MKRILLTGAAGGVAAMIRPLLSEHYRVRLSDIAPVANLLSSEEFIAADLGDIAALGRAIDGVDGIVHLGGFSLESDWDTIRRANIEGAFNLFEAARRAGVKRVVFASSNHAMGFYPRTETVGVERRVRPDSRYGVSKAFGEAIGSFYADRYGLEVMSVRIGHILSAPKTARDLAIWLSPRDFVQLVQIGLEHPDVRNEIVYGASNSSRGWWDNSNAHRLGYRPADSSEEYAAEVMASGEGLSGDPRIDLNQGGLFCILEGPPPGDKARFD